MRKQEELSEQRRREQQRAQVAVGIAAAEGAAAGGAAAERRQRQQRASDVGEAAEHDDGPLGPSDRRQTLAAFRPQRRGVRSAPLGRHSGTVATCMTSSYFYRVIHQNGKNLSALLPCEYLGSYTSGPQAARTPQTQVNERFLPP